MPHSNPIKGDPMGRQEFFESDRKHKKKYNTVYKRGFRRKYQKLSPSVPA